jgi:hypothetical protein
MEWLNGHSFAHMNHKDLMVDVLRFYFSLWNEECLMKHTNNNGEGKLLTYVGYA